MRKITPFRETTDSLFEQFINGDSNALGEFVEQVRGIVINFFIKWEYSPQLIEDAIQDACIDLLRKTPKWEQGKSSACCYFIAIVKKTLYDNRERIYARKFCDIFTEDMTFDNLALSTRSLVPEYSFKKDVREAIDGLTAKQREIVHFRFECDFSTSDAAREIGVRNNAVDSQIILIGKKLAKNPAVCQILGLDPSPAATHEKSELEPEHRRRYLEIVRLRIAVNGTRKKKVCPIWFSVNADRQAKPKPPK